MKDQFTFAEYVQYLIDEARKGNGAVISRDEWADDLTANGFEASVRRADPEAFVGVFVSSPYGQQWVTTFAFPGKTVNSLDTHFQFCLAIVQIFL